MRLTTILAPLAVSALLLAGCSSDADSTGAGDGPDYGKCEVSGKAGEFTLDTIKDNTLIVKADLPSPGWYNGDTVQKIDSGFDYCLLANIAYRAGIDNIQLVNSSFDGLVAGKVGSFDLTLNQITITEERQQVMDFSDPYYDSTAGILVKAGADVTQDNLADKTIGVKQGTVGQILVDKAISPATDPSVFPGDPELQAGVAAGRVEAGIQDLSIVLGAAKNSNGKLEVVGQVATDEHYGVMLPKDSVNTDVVNQIIAQAKSDGTLDSLASAYLTEAYGIDPTTVPIWTLQ